MAIYRKGSLFILLILAGCNLVSAPAGVPKTVPPPTDTVACTVPPTEIPSPSAHTVTPADTPKLDSVRLRSLDGGRYVEVPGTMALTMCVQPRVIVRRQNIALMGLGFGVCCLKRIC